MLGILASKEFQEAEFTLNGRDFKVTKMLPIPAYKLFMAHIRPCLASINNVDFPTYKEGEDEREFEVKMAGAMMEVFAIMDYKHLDEMWKEFARHCIHCKNDAGQWTKVAIDPEGLTQGLDPAHILIMTARAFARNFGESVSTFVKELGLVMPQVEADSEPSQQTLSSTQASEQATSD